MRRSAQVPPVTVFDQRPDIAPMPRPPAAPLARPADGGSARQTDEPAGPGRAYSAAWYSASLSFAWAAASRAIGTRGPEQET